MLDRGPLTTMTAAAFLLVGLLAAPPLAGQRLRFGISPGELELVPGPGGTASGTLLVANYTPQRVRFQVQVADIFLRASGELDVLPPGKLPWSVAAMTRLTPAEFELEGGQAMAVRVAVTVPADARGGRYGVIVVSPTPVFQAGGPRGTVSIAVPRLAARLLVPIRGTEVLRGAITGMVAAPRPGRRGADVKVIFRNGGNVHVRAQGEVVILGADGGLLARLPVAEATILPGGWREFRVAWDAPPLSPGAYTVRAVLDYGADALVAGELTFTVR
ncbi:MAG TPA: hypothetical protein VNN19_05200 [bacterium]|nr:hypothetical protein [bacterium]